MASAILDTAVCMRLALRSPSHSPSRSDRRQFARRALLAPPSRPLRTPVRMNNGMHVPSDGFGGVSPERKAGEILRTFFTFAAVKIVMAQMEGVGRGDLGSYAGQSFVTLRDFVEERPLRAHADEWVAELMRRDEMLGLRILEVREAYARSDFEWDSLRRVAVEDMEAANVGLMRRHAQARFAGLLAGDGEGRGGGQGDDG